MGTDTTGGFSEDLEDVFASQPDDPDMRESVNAWVWDRRAEIGLPRVGVEAVADQWETHDVQVNIAFADGRVFNIFGPGPRHDPFGEGGGGRPRVLGAGPLSLEVVEPYGHLRLRAEGQAVATSVMAQMEGALPGQGVPSTPVDIQLDLFPAVPPWMNGALLEEARLVLETQDEGGLMGHPWRFEQLCHATGTVKIGGERFTIDGGANRIRRQSIRRLATMRGHAWQAALFPSGRGFGYIAYPPRSDGKPTYNEGYVFEGDGDLVPARVVQAPWLRTLAPRGDDVTCVLETVKGTSVTIRGETALSTFMIMPAEVGGGGMQLQQAIVRYSWDGEESVGMLERSTAGASLA
jgi:prepilin-type processing-associated H-X9-DG protein